MVKLMGMKTKIILRSNFLLFWTYGYLYFQFYFGLIFSIWLPYSTENAYALFADTEYFLDCLHYSSFLFRVNPVVQLYYHE